MITVAMSQGGTVVPGYISRFYVQVVEEQTEKVPGYFDESSEGYKGAGFTIKLSGGWSLFGSGDIDAGAQGMYNKYVDLTRSYGFTIQSSQPKSFTHGPEGSLDLIFRVSPAFSIGVGGSYINAKAESALYFLDDYGNSQTMWNTPAVDILSVRVEAYYSLALAPWLGLSLHGGPAFYHVSYSFSRDYLTTNWEDEYYETAAGSTLGLHGGASLALSINSQIALFAEVQVRYARFGTLSGSDKSMYTLMTTDTVETSGTLYNITGESYARLAVLSDATASSKGYQKAVFDYSGVTLGGGLMIRF